MVSKKRREAAIKAWETRRGKWWRNERDFNKVVTEAKRIKKKHPKSKTVVERALKGWELPPSSIVYKIRKAIGDA